MEDEARDQANAALALDNQIKERIETTVSEILHGSALPSLLWQNPLFCEYLTQSIRTAIAVALERDLQYYLQRLHDRTTGY